MSGSATDWTGSGWIVAGLWAFLVLEGSFSIGIAWLAIHMYKRDVERAGRLLLAVEHPGRRRDTGRRFGLSGVILPLLVIMLAWIGLTSRNALYTAPVAGLFVILAARSAAVRLARLKYCPPYVEIHEHGVLYPASQPLHFVAWADVRWYAIREYRSTRGRDWRLIVQAPGHCQNLPVRGEQIAEIEACLEERLRISGAERGDDPDRA